MNKERKALGNVIDAWEALPGNDYCTRAQLEDWLKEKMSPAINHARKILGRKIPEAQT